MDLPWALELLGVNQEAFRFGLARFGQMLNVLVGTYDCDCKIANWKLAFDHLTFTMSPDFIIQ